MDVGAELRVDGLLFGERADGYVDDEAAALEVQSDGSSQRGMWRTR